MTHNTRQNIDETFHWGKEINDDAFKNIVCICNKFLGQSTTKSSNRVAITLNVRTDLKSDDNKTAAAE